LVVSGSTLALVTGVVAGLTAAGTAVYMFWDDIIKFIDSSMSWISNKISNLANMAKNAYQSASSFLGFGDDKDVKINARQEITNMQNQKSPNGTIKVDFGQAPMPMRTQTQSEGIDLFTSLKMGNLAR
jgi:hypothetical protein